MRLVVGFSLIWFVFSGILLSSCQRNNSISLSQDSVDYNIHIRPILSDRCFKCHGPDANMRKANLRLDTREGAMAALKDNPNAHVIVPGDADQSEVFRRVSSNDTSEVMPPPKSNLSLTKSEITLIRKWIEQGAKYKPHWAFIPPIQSDFPAIKRSEWISNEIDYFILERLEASGLHPNEPADRERLLKRASLDITGLPPSLEMQKRFLEDKSDAAYGNIIDELLAQPQFGERMAVYWMDVARYADSHGYQDDGLRTMWPWRDWVIYAFNKNYAYDQFVTWQLAGDLLPNPT